MISTSVRLEKDLHSEFQGICHLQRISLSDAMRVLVTLFVSDESLKSRVKSLIEKERMTA